VPRPYRPFPSSIFAEIIFLKIPLSFATDYLCFNPCLPHLSGLTEEGRGYYIAVYDKEFSKQVKRNDVMRDRDESNSGITI
jgi:hypothetical protein